MKKIFAISIVWTAFFMGLTGYAVNKAQTADPEIFNKVAANINQATGGSLTINATLDSSAPLVDDSWQVQTPQKEISVTVVNSEIEVESYEGAEVQITANGNFDSKKGQRLLEVAAGADTLEVKQTKSGVRVNDVTLKIPKSFKGNLKLTTVNGDVSVSNMALEVLEIKGVSSDVKTSDLQVKEIAIKTVSGDITIDNKEVANLNVASVSGDVKVHTVKNEDTSFSLKSVSGDIQNSMASKKNGKFEVSVKTTSGDITIE